VIGDGHSTVAALIDLENQRRKRLYGSAALTRVQVDTDSRATLKSAGLSLSSVPKAGVEVIVKSTVNDNATKDNVSVRNLIGETLVDEVSRATKVLGIRLAGVDIMTGDPTVTLKEGGGAIIEVNSSPGLHHHYNVNNVHETAPVAVPILQTLLGLDTTTLHAEEMLTLREEGAL
jgi:cyanophycin synthetase